ncbi:hypothetical protein MRB53_019975 [Persea americana]|uniref:Uncharacterized protein n=1 Tax=Persea americana TaxID=3435 RepID=A0ACC2L0W9_PERAE|nr:hypothetical protein MRB53_019975 [Persea americana]
MRRKEKEQERESASTTAGGGWIFDPPTALTNMDLQPALHAHVTSANISTRWTNSPSTTDYVAYTDGSRIRSILFGGTIGPRFACGFFCNGTCDSFIFSIFIATNKSYPEVVWSANPNNPVGENATLHLTQEGDLVLHNVDGSVAWSTNTSGKSVIGMTILPTGNLVLLRKNNSIVWQSFDHPTDTLLLGQKLMAGQRLTASVSDSNWTQGLFYLTVTAEGLFAFAGSNPPQAYREYKYTGTKKNREPSYVIFKNGSLALYIFSAEPSEPYYKFDVPLAPSLQYMRLEPDGHLRVYEWRGQWKVAADLLTFADECDYPTVCGNYGICSNGQCSCPRENDANVSYFQPVNARQPNLGCYETTPLSCQFTQTHVLLHLQDIYYFNYKDGSSSVLRGIDVESCKQACLKNCSCKAALFGYDGVVSDGSCFLHSQLFSLMNNPTEKKSFASSSVLIKVQIPSSSNPTAPTRNEVKLPPSKDDRLHCIVDKSSEDIQLHLEEAVKMIKLGVWCLESDFTRRPSMSTVVKVLEGVVDLEPILDYSFLTSSPTIANTGANLGISTPVASILSGPR